MLHVCSYVLLCYSWIHNELDVAMIGDEVDLTYSYDVSRITFGNIPVLLCVNTYSF